MNLFRVLIILQFCCIIIILYGMNQNLHNILSNGAGIVAVLPAENGAEEE